MHVGYKMGVNMQDKNYIWYKLCCYYHAKTELYDRRLTNLRSPHDPTEAYVTGGIRSLSNANALNVRKFIFEVAKGFGIINYHVNDFNYLHYSAQHWIDEYDRLTENGEMEFINDFM